MITRLNEKLLNSDIQISQRVDAVLTEILDEVLDVSKHYIELNSTLSSNDDVSNKELTSFINMDCKNQKYYSLVFSDLFNKSPLFVCNKELTLRNIDINIVCYLAHYDSNMRRPRGAYIGENTIELYWAVDLNNSNVYPDYKTMKGTLNHELTHILNSKLDYYVNTNSTFYILTNKDLENVKNTIHYDSYKFVKDNFAVNYILYVLWNDDELTAHRASGNTHTLYKTLSNYIDAISRLNNNDTLLLKHFMCCFNKKYEKIKDSVFKSWFLKNSEKRLKLLAKN